MGQLVLLLHANQSDVACRQHAQGGRVESDAVRRLRASLLFVRHLLYLDPGHVDRHILIVLLIVVFEDPGSLSELRLSVQPILTALLVATVQQLVAVAVRQQAELLERCALLLQRVSADALGHLCVLLVFVATRGNLCVLVDGRLGLLPHVLQLLGADLILAMYYSVHARIVDGLF